MADRRRSLYWWGANAFARWVAKSSDERLGRLMSGPARGYVLRRIFLGMQRAFDRSRADEVEAVIDFLVDDDRYRMAIADGRCRWRRKAEGDPDVSVQVGGVPFLKMATGNVTGPELFMRGQLKLKGDLMLGSRLAALFPPPSPD
jgi:putative sterol carrier protein